MEKAAINQRPHLGAVRGLQAQRAGEVGGAPQHGAAGRVVDDDGEVPRQEREIGRAPGDPSSPGGVADSEAELGKAVEDAAGEAVGEEPLLTVELRGHPDGRTPADEWGLRLLWGRCQVQGRGRGRGGAAFVHGRGREE